MRSIVEDLRMACIAFEDASLLLDRLLANGRTALLAHM